MNLLQILLFLEGGNNFMQAHHSFRKRSAAQLQSRRSCNLMISNTKIPESNTLLFKILSIGIAVQEFQKTKISFQPQITIKRILNCTSNMLCLIICVPRIGKTIDTEGNVYLAAEPCKVEQLFDSITKHVSH